MAKQTLILKQILIKIFIIYKTQQEIMLSINGMINLAVYFDKLINLQIILEKFRERLAIIEGFDGRNLFAYIDNTNKNIINERSIRNFLKQKQQHNSKYIVNIIDKTDTGQINSNHFIQFLLPRRNNQLRMLVNKRRGGTFIEPYRDTIQEQVVILRQMFLAIIHQNNTLNEQRRKLFPLKQSRIDSIVYTLDIEKKGYITINNVCKFMRNQAVLISLQEINWFGSIFQTYCRQIDRMYYDELEKLLTGLNKIHELNTIANTKNIKKQKQSNNNKTSNNTFRKQQKNKIQIKNQYLHKSLLKDQKNNINKKLNKGTLNAKQFIKNNMKNGHNNNQIKLCTPIALQNKQPKKYQKKIYDEEEDLRKIKKIQTALQISENKLNSTYKYNLNHHDNSLRVPNNKILYKRANEPNYLSEFAKQLKNVPEYNFNLQKDAYTTPIRDFDRNNTNNPQNSCSPYRKVTSARKVKAGKFLA